MEVFVVSITEKHTFFLLGVDFILHAYPPTYTGNQFYHLC